MIKRIFLLALFVCSGFVGSTQDTLIVGYNLIPPFVSEEDGVLEGPSIWLCDEIQEDLNLHFEYRQMPLDSLLRSLNEDSIQLCASPLTITSKRSENISFTAPYYITHSSLLVNRTSKTDEVWGFIKSFFSLRFFEALGALVIVILIFGFLTWLFERKKNPQEFGDGAKGLWNGFWWSAVTMTTVGYGDKSPKTLAGRIIAIIWMFTAIVIISGFTASIASSLTTNSISNQDKNIEEMKKLPIGTINQSGTHQWLIDNFYDDIHPYETFDECTEALENEEIVAFAYDKPLLKEIIKNDTQDRFDVTNDKFNLQSYAMGMSFSLDDSLRREVNTSILRNIERMDWQVLLNEYGLDD